MSAEGRAEAGPGRSDRLVERGVRWLMILAVTFANVIGTAVVFSMLAWVIPFERPETGSPVLVNLILAGAFILVAVPLVTWVLTRATTAGRAWLKEERPPTTSEQRNMLRTPLVIFVVVALVWAIAATGFGLFNTLVFSAELGGRVSTTVILAGLTTSAIGYMLSERLLRPVAVRALAARPLERPALPGVTARTVSAWALGSAVPMLGLLLIGISALTERDFSRDELALTILVLCAVALTAGFLTTLLVARIMAVPVISLRRALAAVEAGDLDAEVPVYDGTEIGMLQSGFNRMVSGLRERERIRELFGRQVGEDVAREALEGEDVELGGELRTVSVLFIDVVGSTTIAAERDPHDVVELLNRFFAIVIETAAAHGGWVNKFEGDGALVILGAPNEVSDGPARALATAREMIERLQDIEGLEAAVGVATGDAVAGNVGARERYEYTVIGDPVNQAARLSELAKSRDSCILASMAAVEAASPEEAGRWREDGEEVLRGRSEPTRLAVPK